MCIDASQKVCPRNGANRELAKSSHFVILKESLQLHFTGNAWGESFSRGLEKNGRKFAKPRRFCRTRRDARRARSRGGGGSCATSLGEAHENAVGHPPWRRLGRARRDPPERCAICIENKVARPSCHTMGRTNGEAKKSCKNSTSAEFATFLVIGSNVGWMSHECTTATVLLIDYTRGQCFKIGSRWSQVCHRSPKVPPPPNDYYHLLTLAESNNNIELIVCCGDEKGTFRSHGWMDNWSESAMHAVRNWRHMDGAVSERGEGAWCGQELLAFPWNVSHNVYYSYNILLRHSSVSKAGGLSNCKKATTWNGCRSLASDQRQTHSVFSCLSLSRFLKGLIISLRLRRKVAFHVAWLQTVTNSFNWTLSHTYIIAWPNLTKLLT